MVSDSGFMSIENVCAVLIVGDDPHGVRHEMLFIAKTDQRRCAKPWITLAGRTACRTCRLDVATALPRQDLPLVIVAYCPQCNWVWVKEPKEQPVRRWTQRDEDQARKMDQQDTLSILDDEESK